MSTHWSVFTNSGEGDRGWMSKCSEEHHAAILAKLMPPSNRSVAEVVTGEACSPGRSAAGISGLAVGASACPVSSSTFPRAGWPETSSLRCWRWWP